MERPLVVIKNGKEKMRLPGKTMPDGTIRMEMGRGKWMPLVNGDACKANGLDPAVVTRQLSPIIGLAKLGENGYGLHVYTASEWDAMQAATLEAAVPGIHEATRLSNATYNERERYSEAFERMMEDEDNDGVRPPKPENLTIREQLQAHLATHPRAALYLKAQAQADSASWADNTGKGTAGRKAIEILVGGGTIEAAVAALAARREVID